MNRQHGSVGYGIGSWFNKYQEGIPLGEREFRKVTLQARSISLATTPICGTF